MAALTLSAGLQTGAASPAPAGPATLALSDRQLVWVGNRIFQNECAGKRTCLVHWNQGEAFPSLGIGHFIWYPAGVAGRFTESFPDLVRFLSARGQPLPGWLSQLEPLDAPWPDRNTFLAEQDGERAESLRRFLADSQGLQAEFMFQRARRALDRVVSATEDGQRAAIEADLAELASTPGGVYALIDYVNFKGEGLAEGERYQGQGWGLKQVLETMAEQDSGTALQRFRQAAAEVLTRRAENASQAIERERWLPGWLKRVDTYRE
ncbi:MAG: hypothetical protein R3280_04580 [Marinobacter sp.]|uniref:hypothetical protein n=1 Tax=Marinobacter sp. TaxID=50741 RepID=UPI00299E0D02|nr:hypothetical protein [Marinobacter sp.]MDX1633888.1 hypothetical protein [Marinobacter sp.]